MPHVAASHTRADSAPPTRRSSRLARDSRRNNQSALRTDTNSGLSRDQAPLTPAHQHVPSRASTSPPQAYFGPNTQKATDASHMPAVSRDKETSPKVQPRGPVEVAEPPQPRPTDYSRFVPFIAGLSFLLGLAVPYLFASPPSGSATLQLHLEHAVPLLTRHVQLSASLLEHVQEFKTPLLDHSSVRDVRDAAGNKNLETLRFDLNVLSEQLTEAKFLLMDLGADIWQAGSTTHTEITEALPSLASSSVPGSVARLLRATEYVAGKLVDLRASAGSTHHLLLSAHKLGLQVTQSSQWSALETAAGSTERSIWTGKRDGGISRSAKEAGKAIERCGLLAKVVERVQGEVETMLVNLRGVSAGHVRSQGSNELPKMTNELREALDSLAADVKRTQFIKT